jgi:hypothetical protein
VFCSPRGRRGGCGRTFSLCFAGVLPRHTFTASLLWQLLIRWLAGASLKAAVEQLKLSFALETVYRLRRCLRQRLDTIRTRLCREQKPPASSHADPLLQAVEHLREVFPRSECALSAFQLHFQRPFLD